MKTHRGIRKKPKSESTQVFAWGDLIQPLWILSHLDLGAHSVRTGKRLRGCRRERTSRERRASSAALMKRNSHRLNSLPLSGVTWTVLITFQNNLMWVFHGSRSSLSLFARIYFYTWSEVSVFRCWINWLGDEKQLCSHHRLWHFFITAHPHVAFIGFGEVNMPATQNAEVKGCVWITLKSHESLILDFFIMFRLYLHILLLCQVKTWHNKYMFMPLNASNMIIEINARTC